MDKSSLRHIHDPVLLPLKVEVFEVNNVSRGKQILNGRFLVKA